MISFAGMAAEELMYGKWCDGARQDLTDASDCVRLMVCHLGMSPVLGHVYYYYGDNFPVFSQETAKIIDEEVRRISEELYQETIALLRNNRDALELLAAKLLEKKTLTAAEVYQVLGMQEPVVDESNFVSLECTA
jgi:cell division protease FtsH